MEIKADARAEQVRFIEQKLAALAMEEPQVRLLMTMPGIGYFTAMLSRAREYGAGVGVQLGFKLTL